MWCKDEGKDSTTYADKETALQACLDSDKCSSVVRNDCEESEKYQLCNGLEFERYMFSGRCTDIWHPKCELLKRMAYF